MNCIIQTEKLAKRYGNFSAVENLSLRVNEGEIYAFLGLNGAGKTTTIRMLLGMIHPSNGDVMMFGETISPGNLELWRKVGYLVETPHAYPELSVRENLEAARRLHPGTPPGAVDEVIGQLSLGEYADKRAGLLSLGNAQRLGLAKALIHQPIVLILDEPANGLDPAGIVEIRELLRSLTKTKGVTVFMSSHILGEVNRLADRIGIIHRGQLIQEVSTIELDANRRRSLQIEVRDIRQGQKVLLDAGYSTNLINNDRLVVNDPRAIEAPDQIATLLVQSDHPPMQMVIDEEDLEDYFLRLVNIEERREK